MTPVRSSRPSFKQSLINALSPASPPWLSLACKFLGATTYSLSKMPCTKITPDQKNDISYQIHFHNLGGWPQFDAFCLVHCVQSRKGKKAPTPWEALAKKMAYVNFLMVKALDKEVLVLNTHFTFSRPYHDFSFWTFPSFWHGYLNGLFGCKLDKLQTSPCQGGQGY